MPIQEENSAQSYLLGISEMQLNHFISALILNVNVFIVTSPDSMSVINTPRLLATEILERSLPPVTPFLLHLSPRCFLTHASTCPFPDIP